MSNTKHARSLNLNDEVIEKIVAILDGWSKKLTWDCLIDEIELHLQNRYTRQALSKHPRVKSAFDATKEKVSTTLNQDASVSIEVAQMIQKLKRVEAENNRLHKENQLLLSQFAKWAYNAHSQGMTKEILNKPLSLLT